MLTQSGSPLASPQAKHKRVKSSGKNNIELKNKTRRPRTIYRDGMLFLCHGW